MHAPILISVDRVLGLPLVRATTAAVDLKHMGSRQYEVRQTKVYVRRRPAMPHARSDGRCDRMLID